MNAGEFRHKIKITIKGETQQTDYGSFVEDSSTDYTRYGKVKWLAGSEKIEGETLTLQKNAEFTFRKDSITQSIDRIDKIVYNSITFDVSEIMFKGHANEQYVVIKARSYTD
tara:strand:+ start:2514 stop:2849 length:336 start_codon:yes stop_codon:yes gene_type:complete